MSTRERTPGSREEDVWLSDEQLERCAPAEAEPFQAAVPTRMVSNGEYMPHPQTDKQRQVEARVKEIADKAAKKLGKDVSLTVCKTYVGIRTERQFALVDRPLRVPGISLRAASA